MTTSTILSRRGGRCMLLGVTLLILAPLQTFAEQPIGEARPHVSAVWYHDTEIRLTGERLNALRITMEDRQHQLAIRVPGGVGQHEPIEIDGSGGPVERVSVDDEAVPARTVIEELLSPPLPSGDRTIRITLSEPVYHIARLSGDGRRLTIHLVTSGGLSSEDQPAGGEGYATVGLRYADAEDMAQILRRLVNRGDRAIQVAPRRNQLILDRRVERYLDIRELVDRLDRPGDQILIDAQVVELNTDAASQLGLDVSDTLSVRLGEESDYGQAVPLPIQTFLRSPVEVRATLHMLQGEGEAQILANPRVATVDGVPAIMRTEERFPIIVTQSSGDQSYQTKQDIVGGIELSILPRHNGRGEITTEIMTDVTTITGTTQEGYPTTSSRQVETTVRVTSGTAIVIGGLVEKREIRHRDKIPILGSIPLIGVLFTNYRTSVQETDLFVVVTPYLIGGAE